MASSADAERGIGLPGHAAAVVGVLLHAGRAWEQRPAVPRCTRCRTKGYACEPKATAKRRSARPRSSVPQRDAPGLTTYCSKSNRHGTRIGGEPDAPFRARSGDPRHGAGGGHRRNPPRIRPNL